MTDEADAIVVGSGINGLVSAAALARAGWSVILLERNAEIGGFIATEERTLPGYLHDTFSSGTRCSSRAPPTPPSASCYTGTGSSTGRPTAGSPPAWPTTATPRSPTETPNARRRSSPTPRTGLAMLQRLGENTDRRLAGQRGALPRAGAARERSGPQRRAARCRVVAALGGHQRPGVPAPGLPRARGRPPVRAVAAACRLSPDHAAGGFMTPLFAGTLHGFGLPVVAGGAGRFVAAFRSLLVSLGVRVETGFEVDRILVAQGRAVGWRLRAVPSGRAAPYSPR
jgi:choline dehydrogenase-like flavoprotein